MLAKRVEKNGATVSASERLGFWEIRTSRDGKLTGSWLFKSAEEAEKCFSYYVEKINS